MSSSRSCNPSRLPGWSGGHETRRLPRTLGCVAVVVGLLVVVAAPASARGPYRDRERYRTAFDTFTFDGRGAENRTLPLNVFFSVDRNDDQKADYADGSVTPTWVNAALRDGYPKWTRRIPGRANPRCTPPVATWLGYRPASMDSKTRRTNRLRCGEPAEGDSARSRSTRASSWTRPTPTSTTRRAGSSCSRSFTGKRTAAVCRAEVGRDTMSESAARTSHVSCSGACLAAREGCTGRCGRLPPRSPGRSPLAKPRLGIPGVSRGAALR